MASPRSSRLPRSYLYVPGDRPDRLAGAAGRGADALIADLEDAVAEPAKDAARGAVARWLREPERVGGPACWVRINAESVDADLAAVVCRALDGVVVPKAEVDLLELVDAEITRREQENGIDPGTVGVLPLVETAQGLLDVTRLTRAPRVRRLGIGEADLVAELGLMPDRDRHELAPLRLQVVVASAAARIAAPVAPTSTDFRDLEHFAATSRSLQALGFRGRTAIHPAQVAVINEVFSPRPEEVAAARALVEAFEQAGSGVVLDDRGRMVDAAVVRSARQVLELAGEGEQD
ncbi:MAG: HpcH/HpaI aldolase/citrate lyase family protein [Motilibacteraceae bacterium]